MFLVVSSGILCHLSFFGIFHIMIYATVALIALALWTSNNVAFLKLTSSGGFFYPKITV